MYFLNSTASVYKSKLFSPAAAFCHLSCKPFAHKTHFCAFQFNLSTKITMADLLTQQVVVGLQCFSVSFQLTICKVLLQLPKGNCEPMLEGSYMNPIKCSLYSSSLTIHKAFEITLHPAVKSRIRGMTLFFILFALPHIIICYVAFVSNADIIIICGRSQGQTLL